MHNSRDLTAYSLIQRDALAKSRYFEGLLLEAQRLGLLHDAALERIQAQLLDLLVWKSARYTMDDSTSMPSYKAQEILSSLRYCIGFSLEACSTPDEALLALKTQPLRDLYDKGLLLVRRLMQRTRSLFILAMESRLQTPNRAYNDTLLSGIAPFFKRYDPDFSAAACPCSIDYPLSWDVSEEMGVVFMYRFIQHLLTENRFCLCFPPPRIHAMMLGVHVHYRDLLTNVYDQVLLNALGCLLLERDPIALLLTQQDGTRLCSMLAPLPLESLEERLLSLLPMLPGMQEQEPEGFTLLYAAHAVKKLSPAICHAAGKGNLSAWFACSLPGH